VNGFGKIFSLVANILYRILFSQNNMFLKFWKLQNALFMQSYYDLAL